MKRGLPGMLLVAAAMAVGAIPEGVAAHAGKRDSDRGGAERTPPYGDTPREGAATREDRLDARIDRIEKDYGVKVHWRYTERFLPGPWRGQSKGSQIPIGEAERLLGQIERFLKVVPEAVSCRHLRNVYMLHTLEVQGHPVCMAHGQDLFMTGSMGAYLLWPRLFHEFGHVLHERVRLDGALWRSQMPEGAQHVGSKALGGNPFSTGERYYRQGFLMQYSRASLEEEFAILSDYVFTKAEELKGLMRTYPAVRNRVKLTLAYYQALSPDYDFSGYRDVLPEADEPPAGRP